MPVTRLKCAERSAQRLVNVSTTYTISTLGAANCIIDQKKDAEENLAPLTQFSELVVSYYLTERGNLKTRHVRCSGGQK